MKRFWEWYLDLPAAPAGEGTEWRWLWRLPWPGDWPPWLALLAVAAVVAGSIWLYRRDAATIGWPRKAGLMALRLAAMAVVAMWLTEFSLVVIRTGLPSCVILIDTSASMTLPGQPTPVAGTAGGGLDRLSLTQELLTRNEGEFLTQLLRQYQVRLYHFSETATPLVQNQVSDGSQLAAAIEEIRQLRADGKQTRPAAALRKVLTELRGHPPSAAIVFTDGVASLSDTDLLSQAAKTARQQGIQIYPVGLGSDESARDVQLEDLAVDEIAFVGDPILFTARIRAYGCAGETLLVQLRETNDQKVIASQPIIAGSDGQSVKVELLYTPTVAGEFDYRLEVALLPREANPDNNEQTRHVSVRDEKIRVLLVDSAPRYEFRYLKQLLEREKSIELKTLLQDADLEFALEDKTAISSFPVRRDELGAIDIIILGDIAPGSIPSPAAAEVADLVRNRGAGLIVIAGARHAPAEFQGSPLEPLLPFLVNDVKVGVPTEVKDGFHPVLTLEGRKGSYLFRLADSELESQLIWDGLPDWYWHQVILRTKPGVTVFAEHPSQTGEKGKLPLILLQRVGAGKVLYHAGDETWRWRFRAGDAYFGRYWIQAIRYLSRGRIIGEDRAAELTTDRLIYEQGDRILLRARFQEDRSAPPAGENVVVTIEQRGGRRQEVSLTRVPQASAVYEGTATGLPEGEYHSWMTSPSTEKSAVATDFRIEAPVRELQQRTLNRGDLEAAAKLSGGKYYAAMDAERLPGELPPGTPIRLESDHPIPLWNRAELLGVFAALLATEWWFRKRARLV